jgi:hypothetical protein
LVTIGLHLNIQYLRVKQFVLPTANVGLKWKSDTLIAMGELSIYSVNGRNILVLANKARPKFFVTKVSG